MVSCKNNLYSYGNVNSYLIMKFHIAILMKEHNLFKIIIIMFYHIISHTVYAKSFEGENFCGFHGFLLTTNILPLKIFLEYQCCPLITQSLVPPGLKFSTAKVFPTY